MNIQLLSDGRVISCAIYEITGIPNVFGEHRRSPFSFTPYWEKFTKLREHTCPYCGGEIETKKVGSLFNKQYETTCKKCGKKIYETYNEWYLMPDKWRYRTSR